MSITLGNSYFSVSGDIVTPE
jgi:hypothetical protein